MSWHIENAGTPEQVTAAIDESVAASGGMPEAVGAYLKNAVAAILPPDGTSTLVYVKSIGHRPMGCGGTESSEVRLLRSGPWKTSG